MKKKSKNILLILCFIICLSPLYLPVYNTTSIGHVTRLMGQLADRVGLYDNEAKQNLQDKSADIPSGANLMQVTGYMIFYVNELGGFLEEMAPAMVAKADRIINDPDYNGFYGEDSIRWMDSYYADLEEYLDLIAFVMWLPFAITLPLCLSFVNTLRRKPNKKGKMKKTLVPLLCSGCYWALACYFDYKGSLPAYLIQPEFGNLEYYLVILVGFIASVAFFILSGVKPVTEEELNYRDMSLDTLGAQFSAEQEHIYCVTCGKIQGYGDFCLGCGRPLAQPAQERTYCSKCGNLRSDGEFCHHCGADFGVFAHEDVVCHHCGATSVEGEFCANCGASVLDAPPPPEPEPPQPGLCTHCGTPDNAGAFCRNCGQKL